MVLHYLASAPFLKYKKKDFVHSVISDLRKKESVQLKKKPCPFCVSENVLD